jgi:catechol 2,3-dioxygenase-like lactoylglutathione lyase family enzyme
MGLERMDHYTVRTTELARTREFYVDVLGLVDGYRPNFAFPGNWLYLGDFPVVHLIGLDPAADSPVGSGAVDHIAFRAVDLTGMHAHLADLGVDWRDRTVPDQSLRQVFVEDPNGVVIELNFAADELE